MCDTRTGICTNLLWGFVLNSFIQGYMCGGFSSSHFSSARDSFGNLRWASFLCASAFWLVDAQLRGVLHSSLIDDAVEFNRVSIGRTCREFTELKQVSKMTNIFLIFQLRDVQVTLVLIPVLSYVLTRGPAPTTFCPMCTNQTSHVTGAASWQITW